MTVAAEPDAIHLPIKGTHLSLDSRPWLDVGAPASVPTVVALGYPAVADMPFGATVFAKWPSPRANIVSQDSSRVRRAEARK